MIGRKGKVVARRNNGKGKLGSKKKDIPRFSSANLGNHIFSFLASKH